MAKQEQSNVKYLVRIANTDIDGKKKTLFGLTSIKGVSIMLANALCEIANVDKNALIGTLPEAQVQKLNDVLQDPLGSGVPIWMVNRRRDPETNEAGHLLGPNLKFVTENDIKLMRKIKSYKGMRHARGLTVRGQRTKSNFRRSKSRGKGSLGVKKPRK